MAIVFVPPFWAGVITAIVTEGALLLIYAVYQAVKQIKGKK